MSFSLQEPSQLLKLPSVKVGRNLGSAGCPLTIKGPLDLLQSTVGNKKNNTLVGWAVSTP